MNTPIRLMLILTFVCGALMVCLFQGVGHWMSFKGPAIDKVLAGRRVVIGDIRTEDAWISNFEICAYLSPDNQHRYLLLSLVPRDTGQAVPKDQVRFELSGFDHEASIKPVIFVPSDMIHITTEPQLLALDMLSGVTPGNWASARLVLSSSRK